MAESVLGPSEPSLYAVSEVLGDPDETILRLTRRGSIWISIYGIWLCVLGCFVAGGYDLGRTLAFAGVLAATLPLPVVVSRARPGDEARRRTLAGALLWTGAGQAVFGAAITGGLHSPLALVLFMTFSSLYSRYGLSRGGRLAMALFCGGVLSMALGPRSWTGPVLAEPWFTIAACVASIGTIAIHCQFVGALRQTATAAVHQALRARDELADQALARARELELVGSRLSHELKNPLAAIKALVQLTHRSVSDALVAKQLGVVEREVESMSAIVKSHLGFARPLDKLRPMALDVGELADSVLALLDGRAKAAAVTLVRTGSARGTVDAQRVRGALVNLVANAIEACPRGARVEIAIADDGANVRVAVIDTGGGMAPEVVARVGTPFFTTRERGTGLGVVLARAAFEQHGGTLEYRSAPGQGTTVIGTLPRVPGA
jgi:signal transduction histidine kinase